MTTAKFCADCKHAWAAHPGSEWLWCTHPGALAKESRALASPNKRGVLCGHERAGRWFAPCGRAGKLWESK